MDSSSDDTPIVSTPRPSEDPTDTTSFISENDLPVWLRQLAETEAAADAARQAEERRLADEAALAAQAGAAVADAADEISTEPAQDNDQPGESAHSSDHWLARRDRNDPATGRRTAFAELVGERASEQEAFTSGQASAPQSELAELGVFDRAAMTTTVAASQAKEAATEEAAVKRDAKRWITIGAMLIVIAVLLAYILLSGGLK